MFKFPKLPLLLFIAIAGCKKEAPKFCWQTLDAFGNETGAVCNKTEAEMQARYPNSCNYYKTGGEKSCYLVNSSFLPDLTPEKLALLQRCFNLSGTAVKVDCSYCGKWYHREKRTHKPSNTSTYSQIRVEQFCGDTTKTIYQGRQVILKETADSLIVRQFSNNGTNW